MALATQMPASVFRGFQYKKETTPGTPVAADTRLRSFDLGRFEDAGNVERYPNSGSILDGDVRLGTRYATASFSGNIDYNEDALFTLNSALGEVAGAEVVEDEDAIQRVWEVDPVNDYNPMPATIEQNDNVNGEQFSYAFVNGFRFDYSQERCSKSGSIMARARTTHAPTASPSTIEKRVLGRASFKMADTLAGLAGATALRIGMQWSLVYEGIFEPVFPTVADITSYDAIVQVKPNIQLVTSFIKNSTSVALFNNLINSTHKYFEIRVPGPAIDSSTFLHLVQFAGKIGEMPKTSGGAVEQVDFTWIPIEASDMAKPLKITMVNNIP